MGYYTRFDLTDNRKDIIQALGEVSGYGEEINTYSELKWYTCEADMRKVSQMFPDRLVTVHGEGEEVGDIWSMYAKNGKIQFEKATIVVAPFDESKLK